MNSSAEGALFASALAKPAEKRPAFLDAICDGDAALRARLEGRLTDGTSSASRRLPNSSQCSRSAS